MSLQHHFPLLTRTSGTPGHLRVKLGEAFSGTEIGRKQRAIDVQQCHQRDVREVMPFRQHLRTNQNARAAAMNLSQLLL
ncbi:hypothetical protein D3C78_1341120 [compost metagenome]